MNKQFIRVLLLIILFMVTEINTAQALVDIGAISKIEVSDIEYTVKRFSIGMYLGFWGRGIPEREARTISRFKQLNEQKPGEPVMVDFDTIGSHLSDTIMEGYNRVVQQEKGAMKLSPKKEKLLRDKIRLFMVISYIKDITKTYFKMKESKGVVDFCNNVYVRKIKTPLICMSSKETTRREYKLYMPYNKKTGPKNNVMFSFVFNRQNKIWVMNQINLNPELITGKFLLFLAYLK